MKKGACIGRGRTAEVYEWGKNEVLKLYHPGRTIRSEVENAKIIYNLGIPSPAVVEVVNIEGREGIIYERINGPTMTKLIEPNKESISKYATILAETFTFMHQFRTDHPSNLRDELQNKIGFVSKLNEDQKKHIINLIHNIPDDNIICHFDLHPDNIIMSPKGPYIIDWEGVLVGHPLVDICRTSILLQSTALPVGECPKWLKDRSSRLFFHSTFLAAYLHINKLDFDDLIPFELPIIANRLSDGIQEEEHYLLSLLEEKMKNGHD